MKNTLIALVSSVIALSSLAGCADETGIHYNVVIDPNFSIAQQEEIVSAVDSWKTALSYNVDFMTVTVGQCEGWHVANHEQTVHRQLCVHAVDQAWIDANGGITTGSFQTFGRTFRTSSVDSADTFVVSNDPKFPFARLVAHELGHAMGLEHTQEGSLMYFNVGHSESSTPTCIDIAQYLSMRGLPTTDFGECPAAVKFTFQDN